MSQRRLRLLQAVSLNMSMMVGIGPFITIPSFVEAMGGPQAMIAWFLAALLAMCDGLVWSELASAFPGAGGTYHFYDAAYGESRIGRLLKFLFVWQFLFSGPLEVATGAIGLAQYVVYFLPDLGRTAWDWGRLVPGVDQKVAWFQVAAMGVMGLVTLLAYRRIDAAGRVIVVLWAGMLVTVGWVIFAGLGHFNPALAFDFPEGAWRPDGRNARGLGLAVAIGMYDFLGYYQICYLGDEVADPARTVPRSILISVAAIAMVYLALNLSVLGALPYREVMASPHVASDMMFRLYGPGAAGLVTLMIVWTALAATYAALLGYSRVPFAAARAGHFFRAFAATHPTGLFPHRSLLLVSGLAALACLADLGTVIAALLGTRILVQFIGQIATVFVVRRRHGASPCRTFRMPLFPLPPLIALAGWLFVFGTSKWTVIAYSLGSLQLGTVAFALWDRSHGRPRSSTRES